MAASNDLPILTKAAWQPQLFAASPRRSEILPLKPTWKRRLIRMRIHRNMPFEFVAAALPPFLAFADLRAEFTIGDYDDSLSFPSAVPTDVELVWLDFAHYNEKFDIESLASWLSERLLTLRASSAAPILVADGEGPPEFDKKLETVVAQIPGCRIFPRRTLQNRLEDRWVDSRVTNIGATSMSDAAALATAQSLGLLWIPAAVKPALKAVVVDLDNTLYKGVLGEDGIKGIQLTDAHAELQRKILELKRQGLFLAILSRNEPDDVDALFAARTDFPLRLEDFSARSISWDEKADGLNAIAESLRIHPDALLVLDDNMGEIGRLAQRHPMTPLLFSEDAALAARALDLFPGLCRWHQDETDALRAADLAAAHKRAAVLASTTDPLAYMRSLDIRLEFRVNPKSLTSRLTDLANKTNQFVLSLARINEAEVARRLIDSTHLTIAVSLADKLSESGVIAALFFTRKGGYLNVDDICISCRALGRGIENFLILTAIDRAMSCLGTEYASFVFRKGPRNAPARQWLETLAETPLIDENGIVDIRGQEIRSRIGSLPVQIKWNAQ